MGYEIEDFLDESGGHVEDVFPDVRGLVMSGGKPYILIVVEDEAGGVVVTHQGVEDANVPLALREIADLLDAEAVAA